MPGLFLFWGKAKEKVSYNLMDNKLTAELLDEYVESIEVLLGNEVRINWK